MPVGLVQYYKYKLYIEVVSYGYGWLGRLDVHCLSLKTANA